MNYPQVSLATAPEELNRLHGEIESKMRSTVQDAIRAGEILAKVKEGLRHGDFLPWIKLNCNFSERTARNYIAVFQYRSKTASVADLQEAYKQVETLEAQARLSEEQQAKLRIAEFNKTGQKPEGWRRGTDDKLADDERKSEERIAGMQATLKQEIAEEQARKNTDKPKVDFEKVFELLDTQAQQIQKVEQWKDKIRVSHEGKDDPFINAIMEYLGTLPDDNRRVEACYNLIKICKGIANQLQVKQ